ncbi:MAG: helix-turn-helix transcriptional regulator [Clostridiales bacterium]|nr:helix-turn-helix transcriptional regulator [Clostridiales bacterium]
MQINISEKAKEYRVDRGFTQIEVAKAIGLYLNEYIGLEDGSFNPNYNTVLDIAKYYDVPVSYIYDRSRIIVENIIERFINKTSQRVETDDYIEYKYKEFIEEDYT